MNVFVTVTDGRGAPVAHLSKDNFGVQEDGKEQKIAVFDKESPLPLSIVLDIDTSQSTRKDLPLELILRTPLRLTPFCVRSMAWRSTVSASTVDRDRFPSPLTCQSHRSRHRSHSSRIGHGSLRRLIFRSPIAGSPQEERSWSSLPMAATPSARSTIRAPYGQPSKPRPSCIALSLSPLRLALAATLGGEHALIQLSSDTGGRYFYATSAPSLTMPSAKSATNSAPSIFWPTTLPIAFPVPISGAFKCRSPAARPRRASTSATARGTTPRKRNSSSPPDRRAPGAASAANERSGSDNWSPGERSTTRPWRPQVP